MAALVALGGCRTRVAYQGETGVEARFFVQTLEAEVDRSVRPTDVHAAARDAFREFGVVPFQDVVRGVETQLVGDAPGGLPYERVVVETRDTGVSTLIWISMRPVASEIQIRTLFDAMLRRLGL